MPDKPVRAVDPLGIVALANILVQHGFQDCSCEGKPGPGCSCQDKPGPGCSCQDKPVCTCEVECSCENKPVQSDILEVLSNPVFREVVKGLDMNRLKSIEDFLSIADDIRAKMDAKRSTRSSSKKKS